MTQYLTVVHECMDYARWKSVFDADGVNRRAAGLTDLLLVRQQDKPNVIALIMGISDLAKAQAMVASPQLREAMSKAGIIGKPEVHFREGNLSIEPASLYLSLNCRIRDLATFKNGYGMDKADRAAASMKDLGVATEISDPNDLLLVWSVGDKAKVETFMKSPTLAEHQVKNAGVTSPPVMRYWIPG